LCKFARGDIKRLMIFMPPRHGKSWLCSQYFPAWYIGAYYGRVILTSYEATFAATWGRLARNVLTEFGPTVFGVSVAQDSSASDHWELEGAQGQYGVMYTAGVGGGITGKGASRLIIDDPVKNMEAAQSAIIREATWQWYTSTAYTRLEPDGGVMIVQTRWHDDDLSGRILKHGADATGDTHDWTVISLPAIAERDEDYPITGDDPYTRTEGDPLWPERFSLERLQQIRREVGGEVWTPLYQQAPTPAKGVIWRREWFRRYNLLGGVPQAITRTIQAIDSAWETGVANDWSVIATWGYSKNAIYLLDIWRERVEYPELKRAVAAQYAKWHPDVIYLENKASGISLRQEMQRESRLPIVAITPKGSKESRAAAVSPLAESGNIYVPDDASASWAEAWIAEHVRFPRGEHDDMVDTTSLGLSQIVPDDLQVGERVFPH
jgi:predicted phage terminase large subunit-like protein